MENKINIAELLKDCPKGMELDCVIFNDVTLYRIDTSSENEYPIRIETKNGNFLDLTKYGTYSNVEESKCVIFPKGKTTWKGFIPPCKFKDGDVLAEDSCIFIIQKIGDNCNAAKTYCTLHNDGYFDDGSILYFDIDSTKLATEEEKEKLFQAIKDNGYHWNEETKTLDKLVIKPKFKDGDVIVDKYGAVAIYKRVHSSYEEPYVDFHCGITSEYRSFFVKDSDSLQHCGKIDSIRLATEEEKKKLFDVMKDNGYKWDEKTKTLEKLPKFKVGDRIKKGGKIATIVRIHKNFYDVKYDNGIGSFTIDLQDECELLPNKFDINTLIPFESKVLVRSSMDGLWKPAVFGFRNGYNDNAFYIVGGSCWKQCIPYLNNEHLCGTTNDCDEYYKTWK